jgi:hypothetical protein
MEQRCLTKKEIIDLMVAHATLGRFKGDKRDGEAPPITVQNFTTEIYRDGAKRLRARLSRLSLLELATEALAALDYVEALSQIGENAERHVREEDARLLSQRQAELGRLSRLQPAILAAARYCRDRGMKAREAWDVLNKTPFTTDDGSTVEIEGSMLHRLKQRMRVILRDGRQQKRPIRFDQWRQVYWTAAAKPG